MVIQEGYSSERSGRRLDSLEIKFKSRVMQPRKDRVNLSKGGEGIEQDPGS